MGRKDRNWDGRAMKGETLRVRACAATLAKSAVGILAVFFVAEVCAGQVMTIDDEPACDESSSFFLIPSVWTALPTPACIVFLTLRVSGVRRGTRRRGEVEMGWHIVLFQLSPNIQAAEDASGRRRLVAAHHHVPRIHRRIPLRAGGGQPRVWGDFDAEGHMSIILCSPATRARNPASTTRGRAAASTGCSVRALFQRHEVLSSIFANDTAISPKEGWLCDTNPPFGNPRSPKPCATAG